MLSDAEITALVHRFYDRVRQDSVLAPIFAAHVSNWPEHLQTMERFWSSVANTSGRYKGNPMMVHMRLAELQPQHFGRWLSLFRETAFDILSPDAALHVVQRAERIAESFKLGLGFYRNTPLDGDA